MPTKPLHQTRLILGSTSVSRRELLQRLLLPFDVIAPDVDESPLVGETPENLVQRLAEKKARAVAEKVEEALIIGADQVGVLNQKIVGKPHTYENAFQCLREASGQRMKFFVGLCLLDTKHNSCQTVLEEFDVIYRSLTEAMIKQYLQKEQPYQSAGSCKAEGLGITLIEAFEGKDFTALIGLPLIRLTRMLEKTKFSPLFF